MHTPDVPAYLRGSLSLSKAHEAGYEAGSMGLPADVAPEGTSASERRSWLQGWAQGRKAFA